MFIKLTEKQRNKIKIFYEEPDAKSDEYCKYRDLKWDEKQKEAKKNGKEIWNGELYTLKRIYQRDQDGIDIILSKCEFKDRMFKKYLTLSEIRNKFGEDYVKIHCVVGILPITSDGKLILGFKQNTLDFKKGALAYTDGSLNVDELEISSFDDVKAFAQKEFKEETGLDYPTNDFSFIGFKMFVTSFEFMFKLKVDIHSDSVSKISEKSEFKEFKGFNKKELFAYKGSIGDELESLRNEIKLGAEIL